MEVTSSKSIREKFDASRWHSVHGACVHTGLSRKTMLGLLKRGTIPSVRLNSRKVLISRVAVDAFLARMNATAGDATAEGGRLKHQAPAA